MVISSITHQLIFAMAMRKSSRISAKKSLDTLNDVNLVETSASELAGSSEIVESSVITNTSTDTSSSSSTNHVNHSNSLVPRTDQNEVYTNGDSSNKSTIDNGVKHEILEDDLLPLEEVTDNAIITTRETPLQITEPVPPFERIESNIYRCERKREPKDVRRLTCMCELSKEELAKGTPGCGEDCLNRMMMIECGHRCKLQDNCSNKRFQRREYCRIQPFPADKKGWGIRALQNIAGGTFIMEYVGEVIEPEEFMTRVEKYGKKGMIHHYFMALSSDEIIDATLKGNDTRFTNHSCEPNCEIQKWTISGEIRMGLFSTKAILRGEELTIDYKFQRYGKIAQKCFCEKPSCRGFIGSADSSDIYIDGSKRNKNEEPGKENSQDSLDDNDNCRESKDKFKIPRMIASKRPSESSDGQLSDQNASQNSIKKIASQLSQTASLVLGKRFKSDSQLQAPPPPDQSADGTKLTKDQFRLQFELNEMKRQREEDAKEYLKQIEYMRYEIEKARLQRSDFTDSESGYLASSAYFSEDALIAWDGQPTPYLPDEYLTLASGAASYYEDVNVYDDTVIPLPPLTNNLHDVVIEVTSSKDHTLMPDERAVIQTDYGVDCISNQHRDISISRKQFFDPSYPPPGIYYQCVIEDSVYYAPHPFDPQGNPVDFYATTARASWPDFTFLHDQIEGPLPRNWCRACDSKSQRVYYFHKKSGTVSWHFPEGSGVKPNNTISNTNAPCGAAAAKIESIIASADSTSTPPPSQLPSSAAPSNPAQHLVSHSPPGIFAISNGFDKECKKNQQAEPDQSLPKKSKQMVFKLKSKQDRDKFKEEITELVKKTLNPYLKPDCKVGRIVSSDDFKFLARKLTHEVHDREVKSGKLELVINETVKMKARNYIKKYMASKGPVFKKSTGKSDKFDQDGLTEDHIPERQTVVNGSATDPDDVNGDEVITTASETITCNAVNGQSHVEANVE